MMPDEALPEVQPVPQVSAPLFGTQPDATCGDAECCSAPVLPEAALPEVGLPEADRLALYLPLLEHPEIIGREVGFRDLTPLHGRWMKEIMFGQQDYTLQAHRGSYKSSCLAVAIALILVLFPRRNIIFLRKADVDVSEMLQMVSKVLRQPIMTDLAQAIYGVELQIASESMNHLSTNLWTSAMGAPQLLGIGLRSSITGKHAFYVITDDICNLSDRISRAERERTKLQYDELQNIRNRGGRIINLGTPWHKEDVFSRMPNIHRYDCYHTGLIAPEKLEELRASMTPALFAANYELLHIASEEAIFETNPVFTEDASLLRDGLAHVDAAYGGSDSTAFTCGCRREGKIYLYGRLWHKHVDQVLDQILAEADRLMCYPLYCENNGDKGFLKKEIFSRQRWAREYTEHQNKFIKITSHLRKWWPNIVFLRGTDPEYINEILDYTQQADHDDAPDSAACVCRLLDSGFRRGT